MPFRRGSSMVAINSVAEGSEAGTARWSLPRLIEISQVRRLLVLFCGHQHAIRAWKIIFLADENLRVVLGATDLGPLRPRVGITNVLLVHGPGPRQCVVGHRDFIVKDVWIC